MSTVKAHPLRGESGVTLAELAVTLALFALIMLGVVGTWTKAQEAYFVGSETAEAQQNVRAAIDFMVREIRSAGRDLTDCAFDYATSATFTGADCDATKAGSCGTLLGGGYTANGCQSIFAMPFADATATTLRIRADRNDNGTIAGTANSDASDPGSGNVIYQYVPAGSCPSGIPVACITRDDGTGPQAMVAVDIQGLTFTYYPRPGFPPCNGSPTPNPCPMFTGGVPADQADTDNVGRIAISVTAVQQTVGQQISRTLVTDVYLRNRN